MANIYGTNSSDNNTFSIIGSWPFFMIYNPQINGTETADSIYGLNGNDIIYGNGGNDYLDGGLGIDTMYGGKGNDVFIVDNPLDVVIEKTYFLNIRLPSGNTLTSTLGPIVTIELEEGIDLVSSFISNYKLPEHVENLTLQGSALKGEGNKLDNIIQGNAGNNDLSGFSGNDKIFGGYGDDVLSGGEGDDTLYGDNGNDLLIGSTGNDTLNGGQGYDIFQMKPWSYDGIDTIYGFNPQEDTIDFIPVVGTISTDQLALSNQKLAPSAYYQGYGFTGNGFLNLCGIYLDTSNGYLWYNPTAFVSGDSHHFATIDIASVVGGINSVSIDDFSLMYLGL
ncbi:calcium-binding protein [Nitrosomonas supralitoralis]|nr:calcium-binding protein [Nitrosomonas supralitoralis]